MLHPPELEQRPVLALKPRPLWRQQAAVTLQLHEQKFAKVQVQATAAMRPQAGLQYHPEHRPLRRPAQQRLALPSEQQLTLYVRTPLRQFLTPHRFAVACRLAWSWNLVPAR